MANTKAKPKTTAKRSGKPASGSKLASGSQLVVRPSSAVLPRGPANQSSRTQGGVNNVLSRLYTITYQQSVNGQLVLVTLQADTPFSMPLVGQPLEVRHDGVLISGLVRRIEWFSSTFRDGTGYGTMDLFIVHVA